MRVSVCVCVVFFLMIRRPPRSTLTDTLFPYTTIYTGLHVPDARRPAHDPLSTTPPAAACALALYTVIPDVRRARKPKVSGARALRPGIHASVRAADGWIPDRSEERRVGNECVSTCRSRGAPDH